MYSFYSDSPTKRYYYCRGLEIETSSVNEAHNNSTMPMSHSGIIFERHENCSEMKWTLYWKRYFSITSMLYL
jgi:hypothetical protein